MVAGRSGLGEAGPASQCADLDEEAAQGRRDDLDTQFGAAHARDELVDVLIGDDDRATTSLDLGAQVLARPLPRRSFCADNLNKPYLECNKLEIKGSAPGGPTFTAETVLGALPKKTRACPRVHDPGRPGARRRAWHPPPPISPAALAFAQPP